MADMLKQADEMQTTIDTMEKMSALTEQMADVTHEHGRQDARAWSSTSPNCATTSPNFDDFFRPIRNYFYWEPHCFDIPVCWSIRSVFDTLDGIDTMTDDVQEPPAATWSSLDTLMPQLVALMPPDDRRP